MISGIVKLSILITSIWNIDTAIQETTPLIASYIPYSCIIRRILLISAYSLISDCQLAT